MFANYNFNTKYIGTRIIMHHIQANKVFGMYLLANKPGQPPSTKPRTIICKLRDWKQREEVLRKARKEKPTGIYIMEDLASATLKKREPQVPKLFAAKEAGKIAYFILDRLVIRDKPADKSAPAVDS